MFKVKIDVKLWTSGLYLMLSTRSLCKPLYLYIRKIGALGRPNVNFKYSISFILLFPEERRGHKIYSSGQNSNWVSP